MRSRSKIGHYTKRDQQKAAASESGRYNGRITETMSEFAQTERTQVKRLPKRGHYDRETVHKILDEAFVCHVGFVVDGQRS